MNYLHKPFAIFIIPVYHSILELLHLTRENFKPISKFIAIIFISFLFASSLGYYQQALLCLKWIGLGVLSSIGLGFGMHTFVLFLAPHIAAVTLAAYTCNSLNFPQPPYPDEVICPNQGFNEHITSLKILQKVALESFMWGLGTAIGELPPYLAARFRAQAIERQFGGDRVQATQKEATWEHWMIWVINKIGFIGILLCAAIPNPLFDAAGVASGTAQIPFLTFFGATFLGKAVIKVFIQTSFIVFMFTEESLLWLKGLGDFKFNTYFVSLIEEQRKKILSPHTPSFESPLSISNVFGWLVNAILIIFLLSIIKLLDTNYRDRRAKVKTQRKIK